MVTWIALVIETTGQTVETGKHSRQADREEEEEERADRERSRRRKRETHLILFSCPTPLPRFASAVAHP